LDVFYCATANIIILGALQGRLTPNLTLVTTILGTLAYTVNETILFNFDDLSIH